MRKYIVGFLVQNNQVLLIEKNKPEWQKGLYNGIGGKIENNELIAEAMVREFQEETTLVTTEEDWERRITIMGTDYECHFFLYAGNNVDINHAETVTDEQLIIIDLEKISTSKKLIPNLRWIIPFCIDTQYKFIRVVDDTK